MFTLEELILIERTLWQERARLMRLYTANAASGNVEAIAEEVKRVFNLGVKIKDEIARLRELI